VSEHFNLKFGIADFRLYQFSKRIPKRARIAGSLTFAAAGLRHSRAPFPPERDCAESQSQQYQWDLTRKVFLRLISEGSSESDF
jgi:hypothetical protein